MASVLSQTFTDLELIIVDDGSVDATARICLSLEKSDGRVRILRQQNSGVSVSRNLGISAAKGEFIAFVDADDSLYESAFADMLDVIDRSGCDCCACGYYDEFLDGSRTVRPAPMKDGSYDFNDVQKGIVLPLLQDRVREGLLLGTVWRYLFLNDVITKNGIKFCGAYLEDEMFLIEYFAHSCHLAVVDRPLYSYFQNPDSVTKRYLPTFIDTFLKTIEIKSGLVKKFSLPVSVDWRLNSAWAGLLIAVSNEFAPGNPGGGADEIRKIAAIPLFAEAIDNYKPEGMSRNKTITAYCLRHRQYAALTALYTMKNRRRR